MGESWLTFDCFGTLVSWQAGFPAILQRVADERAGQLALAYHRFEAEEERGEYKPYRRVLHDTLARAAAATGLALSSADVDVLARRWDEQPVFGDVEPELRALRESGWKLAVLTNCDDDLFARTRATLPVAMDSVVTSEQVRSYKPALGHFQRFDELSSGRAQWIHVACSWFHDIAPARASNVPRIWIDRDRTGDDPSAATAVLPSMHGLGDALKRIASVPGRR